MSRAIQFTNNIVDAISATILNGQTKTGIIDTYGTTVTAIELPASFDGTTLTFEISSDGVNFKGYYNIDNIAVSITCTQDRIYGLAAQDFFPVRFVKIVSDAAETADRIIKLIPKPI